MAFAGLRGTSGTQGPGTDERPKSFREGILFADPNGEAPLFALTSKMQSEVVDDPEFNWWEEDLDIVRVTTNASVYGTTDTTLTLTSGGLNLVKGDVLLIEKTEVASYNNEAILVTSVTNDTTIVVVRAVAGTTGAPIAASSNLMKIGNAHEEGSVAANISNRNPTKKTNYCQIFKTTCGVTRTALKTYLRTGDPWKNDKKRKAFDHARDIEWALLYGFKNEDTAGTFAKRYTGGLRTWITTNVKIYTTTPTEDDFLNDTYQVFNFNAAGAGNERLVLCGNGFLNTLNKLARDSASTQINFDSTLKYYGMELHKWVIPQGTFYIKTHPQMSRNAKFTNSAFIINPRGLKYRYIAGRDGMFEDNIQTPGKDVREAQWLTECGLEVQHEKTMAYLGNFTKP